MPVQKKVFPAGLFLLLLLLNSCGYLERTKENVPANAKLYLPTGATLQTVMDSIAPHVQNIESFQKAASSMKLRRIYPGRYTLQKGETNKSILDKLLLGKQDEIEITIGNYGSIFELATKLDPLLETSASSLLTAIAHRDEARGLDSLQMIYFLSPNTYRFHWTQTPEEIVEKISAPYRRYWTPEKRAQLAASSGLSEKEAVTLASIVQLESYRADEQPRVAGLYHNRLRLGMKLDADPTVIFAKKQKIGWQTKIERVYFKDLQLPSPYNTYVNKGLPPGPICMPNPSAIDAVLQPAPSEFIYFVADPSQPGYHLYAKTLAEQEKNAQVYRAWVEKNNIR